MKRREVLKRIGIASAAVVATPSVLSILNSCTTQAELWKPTLFSVRQGQLLTKMTNVFLPQTDLPSASELNVPEFIDRFIVEKYNTIDQKHFLTAYTKMAETVEAESKREIKNLSDGHLQAFLDRHLKVKNEEDLERGQNPEFEGFTTSECLNLLRKLSIIAYLNTEKIGEEALAYDPVPGAYYCDDLQKLTQGRSWSLGSSLYS